MFLKFQTKDDDKPRYVLTVSPLGRIGSSTYDASRAMPLEPYQVSLAQSYYRGEAKTPQNNKGFAHEIECKHEIINLEVLTEVRRFEQEQAKSA